MKITAYRTAHWRQPLSRPIGDVNNLDGVEVFDIGVLWIDTDEGISGIAFSAADIEDVFPLLEGRDPRETLGIWRSLTADRFAEGTRRAHAFRRETRLRFVPTIRSSLRPGHRRSRCAGLWSGVCGSGRTLPRDTPA